MTSNLPENYTDFLFKSSENFWIAKQILLYPKYLHNPATLLYMITV